MNKAAHLAGLFFIDELERVEVFDLGCEANRVAGEIECLDLSHAAVACKEPLPDVGCSFAHAADEAETRDDDAAIHRIHCYLAAF